MQAVEILKTIWNFFENASQTFSEFFQMIKNFFTEVSQYTVGVGIGSILGVIVTCVVIAFTIRILIEVL